MFPAMKGRHWLRTSSLTSCWISVSWNVVSNLVHEVTIRCHVRYYGVTLLLIAIPQRDRSLYSVPVCDHTYAVVLQCDTEEASLFPRTRHVPFSLLPCVPIPIISSPSRPLRPDGSNKCFSPPRLVSLLLCSCCVNCCSVCLIGLSQSAPKWACVVFYLRSCEGEEV